MGRDSAGRGNGQARRLNTDTSFVMLRLPFFTAWILAGKLDSLALIIMNRDTREVVERWQFDIQVEEPPPESESGGKENQ